MIGALFDGRDFLLQISPRVFLLTLLNAETFQFMLCTGLPICYMISVSCAEMTLRPAYPRSLTDFRPRFGASLLSVPPCLTPSHRA